MTSNYYFVVENLCLAQIVNVPRKSRLNKKVKTRVIKRSFLQ